ncbi:HEAT repeat domain-containing protein [Acaryochloris sp. CCMEE 5410]|nr:HEAT repeat domain-containing protein [Acaryochloris sp. CCMEE 5410]
MHFLDDPEGDIAGRAATILGEIARELNSTAAISALGAAITHQSAYVRNNIIDALGSSYSKTAIPFLEAAYSDPEWENRRRVMDAMAQIPSEEVIPTIVEAFQDYHVKVRYAAMEALRYISGTNTGYKVAISHSNNVLLHNSDPVMRTIAVEALQHSGDKSVLPLLEASLTTEDNPFIRSKIKNAIDRFEELPANIRSLPPWDRIRWRIKRTTGKHNDKTYQKSLSLDSQIDEDILIQKLQTKGHAARCEAIRLLKECNNSEFMYSTAIKIIRNHLFQVKDSEEIYNIVEELQSIQKQCNFYHNNFYQLAKEFPLEIFSTCWGISAININVKNAYGIAGHVSGNQVIHSSLSKEDTV